MIKSLTPYLVFQGECQKAIELYTSAFDAKINFLKTFAEAPFEVPEEHKGFIFDSELALGDYIIKASDHLPEQTITTGSNNSVFLFFDDLEEMKNVFNKLSNEAEIFFPITANFGMLKDRFGIQWMMESE